VDRELTRGDPVTIQSARSGQAFISGSDEVVGIICARSPGYREVTLDFTSETKGAAEAGEPKFAHRGRSGEKSTENRKELRVGAIKLAAITIARRARRDHGESYFKSAQFSQLVGDLIFARHARATALQTDLPM